MTNTRKFDLAQLEEARDSALSPEGKAQRNALLEIVYEQSKDSYLEKLRIKLTDCMKQGDVKGVFAVRRLVENYAKSPAFKLNLAKKAAKFDKIKANNILTKGV